MRLNAGVDILPHVPMKEAFPEKFARQISEKGIAVARHL